MKRVLCALFAIGLLLSVAFSAAAGSIADWDAKWDDAVSDSAVLALSPGATEKEMCFAWFSQLTAKNEFQLGTNAEMTDAVSVSVQEKITLTGQKVCRVTASDLRPDTEYFYRYTKNGVWSAPTSFRTQGKTCTALFVSDAQLGRSGDWRSKDVLLHDTAGWDTTLEQGVALYPDTSLILSAGDQAEKGFSEQEYRLLLAPQTLRHLPIAPVVGNHEFYFPYLNLHFNLPNRIGSVIVHSAGDEPYYFVRGNALFIQLESNDLLAWDHEAVLDRAVRAYPDAKWRVVMLHHSLYSCENSETDGPLLRKTLTPILQRYNINLVLGGHTHRYSRSFPLRDGVFAENGITYLEGGCSSGCNSKASPDTPPSYTAASFPQRDMPVYCALEFGEDAIRIHAYAVENGESVQIDSGVVRSCTRDDSGAHMRPWSRLLHDVLSVFGKLISVWYA